MPTLSFTRNLLRHVDAPAARVEGATLRDALEAYFGAHPGVRGYILDDQGAIRKHVAVFVNRDQVMDREGLTDRLDEDDEVYVIQALSGG